MVRPGQVVSALCRQLNPHVLPALVMDALQILEEIGCVQSVFLPPAPRTDLFSRTSRTGNVAPECKVDSVWAVDVPVDSPLRFASFMEAVQGYCQQSDAGASQ
ncbi:hypothetical protein EGW08_016891 [Elysia chlorotica]|uniref:Uncharacterized protein n=1 Tax=Elysia chlorotica TaxID=188477 RepID=A0A433T1D2_ELYCH|nr:hypothetical protein EGW08_016891 [Elysia chlorotica]